MLEVRGGESSRQTGEEETHVRKQRDTFPSILRLPPEILQVSLVTWEFNASKALPVDASCSSSSYFLLSPLLLPPSPLPSPSPLLSPCGMRCQSLISLVWLLPGSPPFPARFFDLRSPHVSITDPKSNYRRWVTSHDEERPWKSLGGSAGQAAKAGLYFTCWQVAGLC